MISGVDETAARWQHRSIGVGNQAECWVCSCMCVRCYRSCRSACNGSAQEEGENKGVHRGVLLGPDGLVIHCSHSLPKKLVKFCGFFSDGVANVTRWVGGRDNRSCVSRKQDAEIEYRWFL